jgi:hypothetical protein
MDSSKDPIFTNLSVLYSGECPRVDIVVVENLGERPFQSWTYQKEGHVVAWLQDPVFRVFSFSYEITKKSYPRSLAKSLVQKLRGFQQRYFRLVSISFTYLFWQTERPIVLLGVGFGGIICMKVSQFINLGLY